jgi:hypothetical protein
MPRNTDLPPIRQTLDAKRIRAAVISLGTMEHTLVDLSRFGIDLEPIDHRRLQDGDAQALAAWDVALLRCPRDQQSAEGPSVLVRTLLETAVSTGLGVCAVVNPPVEAVRLWLSGGADAVAFTDDSHSLLAVAVHTAYNSAVLRRSLTQKVTELEKKLEATQLINRAKSIIAQQLQISEHDALQRLRKQARSQRRAMSELAKVIIEANSILQGTMISPPAAGRTDRDGRPVPPVVQSDGNATMMEFDEQDPE